MDDLSRVKLLEGMGRMNHEHVSTKNGEKWEEFETSRTLPVFGRMINYMKPLHSTQYGHVGLMRDP